MLGAFAVGPLADRHGRKTMLVVSMAVFGIASLASAFSGGLASLTWLRFLTGVGLGGAMPMTITLASEYCPRRPPVVARDADVLRLHYRIGAGRHHRRAGAARLRLARAAARRRRRAAAAWRRCSGWLLPESVRYLVMQGGAARPHRRRAPAHRTRRRTFAARRFVDAAVTTASPVRAVVRRRAADGNAAPVAGLLHEPARRLPADELDADADAAGLGRVAGGRRGDRRPCTRSAARSGPFSSGD